MYAVKRESNEEICRGCLSTDRRLAPLANYDLFFSLLDEKQKLEVLNSPTVHLCWECNALLRKMKMFQTQTQHAHRLLEELANELPTKGLSQLTTCYKQDYDVVIEEQFEGPVKEEIKIQIDVFDHNLNSDNDHFFEETDYLETQTDLDLFVETTENHLIETIPRKKYKRKLKRVKTTSQQTKNKRQKIETVPVKKVEVKKGNRAGLRSSGETLPSLYPNKGKESKKEFMKNKIKVDSTTKRKYKQRKRKYTNRRNPTNTVKVKNETQIRCAKDTVGTDTVVTKDHAEANTDTELENPDVKNEKEKIDDIEPNNDEIDESDGENDNSNNDDPDFEAELNKPNNTDQIKKKTVSEDKWLRGDLITFDVIDELDEYFTKVDLSPEGVKNILDNELSYKTEEKPFSCNYCGFCFQLCRVLTKHKSTRHKQIARCRNPVYLMYRCNMCNKIIRKEHAEAHMKYLHRWRYYCKECDIYFWDVERGKSHCLEVHNHRSHSCTLCPYVAFSSKGLAGHMRGRHTPVTCNECGKILIGTRSLHTHKRKHQSDDSPPEQRYCVSCDKQFKSMYCYELHVKNSGVHNGKTQEKIPCTECGKLMSGKNSLQLHYDYFHGDKMRFQCPHCDKYYSSKFCLRKHIEAVHLKKKHPKDKLCSYCGRGFAFARALKYHIRTHTGERPHVCPHCPAAFAQPFPLRKHRATQHGEPLSTKDKEAPTRIA